MTEPQFKTIDGHKIDLPDGRSVWAGEHDDSWYLQFEDGNGNSRKLRISYEAAAALVQLLTTKPDEVLRFVVKIKKPGEQFEWQQIIHPELPPAAESQP